MKICHFCNNEYYSIRENSKFCNSSCAAKNRIPELIIRNKKRRKYEYVEGKTRQQIYWINNKDSRLKHLKKDTDKRYRLLNFLGGKCIKCGYSNDIRALVLDHINSDGKMDRIRVGNRIYRYYVTRLEEALTKLQVLCANCNLIKSFECNEHNISRRVI